MNRRRLSVPLLVSKGFKYFGTGGALGFDTIAAQVVLSVKATNPEVKLILVLTSPQLETKGGEDMKEMTELKMVYELVISRANPLDNPRYELLNHAQRKMKEEILSVIRQTNPNYPEMDYDDDVFKYIVEFNDEYCIDSFAKGISFALNFKEQAERFMNEKYDY